MPTPQDASRSGSALAPESLGSRTIGSVFGGRHHREVVPETLALRTVPLPLVYGTCKIPLLLIDKIKPTLGYLRLWEAEHYYSYGERIRVEEWTSYGFFSVLMCVDAGTTGASEPNWAPMNLLSPPIMGDGTATWYLLSADWEQSNVNGNVKRVYCQSFVGALCEGEINDVKKMHLDTCTIYVHDSKVCGLQTCNGPDDLSQTLPGTYDSSGYQHTALVYPHTDPFVTNMLGYDFVTVGSFHSDTSEMPNLAFTVCGITFDGGSPYQVNPADIIEDLITHTRRGCALSSDLIDSSITGSGVTTYRTYCNASGLRIALYVDVKKTCLEIISGILNSTNSDIFFSEGKIKIRPRSDQTISNPRYGTGHYVPDTTPVYALGVDDFLGTENPVEIERVSYADTFNCYPVEYTDKTADYARMIVEDPDTTDIDNRGIKRSDSIQLPVIFGDGEPAIMLSRIFAQRSLNVRNTYKFKLSWKYILLEPTDIISITEPGISAVSLPVKITQIEEDDDGLTITAEDYPEGVSASVPYVPQPPTGYDSDEIPAQQYPLDPIFTVASFWVYLSSTQTIGVDTDTIVEFDTAKYNLNNIFDLGSYSYTVAIDGIFDLSFNITTASQLDAGYTLRAYIFIGTASTGIGNSITAESNIPAGLVIERTVHGLHLAAGSVVTVKVFQDTKNDFDLDYGENKTFFSCSLT